MKCIPQPLCIINMEKRIEGSSEHLNNIPRRKMCKFQQLYKIGKVIHKECM